MSGMATYRPVWQPGDPTPLCLCGCGQPVKLAIATKSDIGIRKGQPFNYVNGHNPVDADKMGLARWGDSIPIEDFRKVFWGVIKQKGWSVPEVEQRIGIFISSTLYARNRKWVSKDWAFRVFRRMAGGATVPSGKELRSLERARRRQSQIKAEEAQRVERQSVRQKTMIDA